MLCAHTDLLQRLGDAEALITELRSRILGLTALNADLTRQLRKGAEDAVALRAAEARAKELEAQLAAAAKEAAGLQVLGLLRLCRPSEKDALGPMNVTLLYAQQSAVDASSRQCCRIDLGRRMSQCRRLTWRWRTP